MCIRDREGSAGLVHPARELSKVKPFKFSSGVIVRRNWNPAVVSQVFSLFEGVEASILQKPTPGARQKHVFVVSRSNEFRKVFVCLHPCDLGQGKKLASTDHLNVSRGPGRREKRMSTIDDNWHTVTTGLLEHLDELRTRLNSEGLAGQHRWVFTLASAGGKGISKSVRVELEVVADRQPVHPVSF